MPGRRLKSPADVVKKTIERARGAPADWEAGLANASGTIKANMQAAIPRWTQAMQDAIQRGAFAKGIAHVTDEQIIAAARKVGGNAWLNGLTSREDKLAAAWNILGPKLQAHMDRIAAMPNVTDADREKRMVENLRGMRALRIV